MRGFGFGERTANACKARQISTRYADAHRSISTLCAVSDTPLRSQLGIGREVHSSLSLNHTSTSSRDTQAMAQPSGLDFDAFLASDDDFEESLLAIELEGEPPSTNLNAFASSQHAAEQELEQGRRDDNAYEITGFGEGGELQNSYEARAAP